MERVARTDPRAQLINAQLKRLDVSLRWLAKEIGSHHVQVSSWLNGDAKPRDENVWRRMLEALRGYEQSAQIAAPVTLQKVGLRQILVYPSISAGVMSSTQADVEPLLVKDWGNDRERWGRTIEGFSMSPELEPGDIAVFEARPWEPYHVVHAFDNGEDTVKVVRAVGSQCELVPVNPDYPTLNGSAANIKGVLVMRIRKGQFDEVTTTEYPHGMRVRILKTE